MIQRISIATVSCLLIALALWACGEDVRAIDPGVGDPDTSEDAADQSLTPDAADSAEEVSDVGADMAVEVAEDALPETAETDEGGDLAEPDGVGEQFFPPDGDGPYTVSRSDESVEVSAGEFDVIVIVPDGAEGETFPLVVVNHGFQLSAGNFAASGERLATHGFLVLLPSMGDGLFNAFSHTDLATIQQDLLDWALNQARVPGGRFFGRIDAAKIGVGGHSRGGKASLMLAIGDDRVTASFNIEPVDSGPPFGGDDPALYPSVTPESMDQLSIPTGYIGAELSASGAIPCAPVADNYHAYFEVSPTPSYEWFVRDAGHNAFVEGCDFQCRLACPTGDQDGFALAFARTAMVGFYQVYLKGDLRYQSWLDGEALDALGDQVITTTR